MQGRFGIIVKRTFIKYDTDYWIIVMYKKLNPDNPDVISFVFIGNKLKDRDTKKKGIHKAKGSYTIDKSILINSSGLSLEGLFACQN